MFLPLSNNLQLGRLDSTERGRAGLRCECPTPGVFYLKTGGYNSPEPHARKAGGPVCGNGRLGDFFWISGSRGSASFFNSLEDLKSLRSLLPITLGKDNEKIVTSPHTWDTSTLFVGADHSIWGSRSPGLGEGITPPVGRGRCRRLAPCKSHILLLKNRQPVSGRHVDHPMCGIARLAPASPGGSHHPICGRKQLIRPSGQSRVNHPVYGGLLDLQVLSQGSQHPVCGKRSAHHPVCGRKQLIRPASNQGLITLFMGGC